MRVRDNLIGIRLEIMKKKMGLRTREQVIDKLLTESLLRKPESLRKIVRKHIEKG